MKKMFLYEDNKIQLWIDAGSSHRSFDFNCLTTFINKNTNFKIFEIITNKLKQEDLSILRTKIS